MIFNVNYLVEILQFQVILYFEICWQIILQLIFTLISTYKRDCIALCFILHMRL